MSTQQVPAGQAPQESGSTAVNDSAGPLATPEPTPEPEEATAIASELKKLPAPKPAASLRPTGIAKRVVDKRGNKKLNGGRQNETVKEILACDATDYRKMLSLPESATQDDIKARYERLATMTNPSHNKSQGAQIAYERIMTAAKSLGMTDTNYKDEDVSLEPEDVVMEDDRESLTLSIYNDATPCVRALLKDPRLPDPKYELAGLNDKIKELCVADQVDETEVQKTQIDIDAVVAIATKAHEARLNSDVNPTAASAEIEQAQKLLSDLCSERGYPQTWLGPEQPKPDFSQEQVAPKVGLRAEVRPGFTNQGHRIAVYRPMRMGDRFYVEKEVNGQATWFAESTNEIGGKAARAYIESEAKNTLGQATRKYRKKDCDSYGDIVHVGCKPVHTQTESNNGRKPRRPLTDVLAIFEGVETHMVFSDLVAMLGAADALADIESYYDNRSMDYPWDIEPEKTIKVVKRKSDTPVQKFDNPKSGISSTDTRDSLGSGNTDMVIMVAQLAADVKELKSRESRLDNIEKMMTQITAKLNN